jgi:xanthine dehydrogenase YagT iron-sulfur-binding subunit
LIRKERVYLRSQLTSALIIKITKSFQQLQPIFDETIMTENQQEDLASLPASIGNQIGDPPETQQAHQAHQPQTSQDPQQASEARFKYRSIQKNITQHASLPAVSAASQNKPRFFLPQLTRRSFLALIGATGAVGAVTPADVFAVEPAAAPPATTDGNITRLTVNGVQREAKVDVRTTLLDYLREDLQLTGTKKGCDHGQCGACTVHVNGRRVNSCLSLVAMHDGDNVTTIEGLGTPDHLHPMQAAFVEHDGMQCGYCTAGQIMSAVALLKEPCGRANADVKEAMSGNICRCGAYSNIVAAIQQVRKV